MDVNDTRDNTNREAVRSRSRRDSNNSSTYFDARNYNSNYNIEEEEIEEHPMMLLDQSNYVRKAIIPSLFSIIAFSLAYYGMTVPCVFVNSHVTYNSGIDAYLGIGFYSYELNGECYSTASDYRPDKYLETGRVFSVFSLLFGGVGTLTICLALCYGFTRFERCIAAFILFAASLSSGLSLLIINSSLCTNDVVVVGQVLSSDCELYTGSRCAISSMVFWFFASVSIICTVVHDDNNNSMSDSDSRSNEELNYNYMIRQNNDEQQTNTNALFNSANTITVPLL